MVSREIIFGVVPEATSDWKPEIAPHAIVINANGNSLPAKTGPSPAVAKGVSAGIRSGGRVIRIATPSATTGVIFRKGERQSRGQSSIQTGRTDAMKPEASIVTAIDGPLGVKAP